MQENRDDKWRVAKWDKEHDIDGDEEEREIRELERSLGVPRDFVPDSVPAPVIRAESSSSVGKGLISRGPASSSGVGKVIENRGPTKASAGKDMDVQGPAGDNHESPGGEAAGEGAPKRQRVTPANRKRTRGELPEGPQDSKMDIIGDEVMNMTIENKYNYSDGNKLVHEFSQNKWGIAVTMDGNNSGINGVVHKIQMSLGNHFIHFGNDGWITTNS